MFTLKFAFHHVLQNLRALKNNLNCRKHKYKLVEEQKKQVNRIFINEKLAVKVIMDCRTTSAHKFRKRLRIQAIWCHFNKRTISNN